MSVKLSEIVVCAIADPDVAGPVYHSLAHLTLARFSGEQGFVRANAVNGGAFSQVLLSGERGLTITLDGLSDGSTGEALLHSGFFDGKARLLRIDTAQGKQLTGSFRIARLRQDATGERFERITVELRSDGVITLA